MVVPLLLTTAQLSAVAFRGERLDAVAGFSRQAIRDDLKTAGRSTYETDRATGERSELALDEAIRRFKEN